VLPVNPRRRLKGARRINLNVSITQASCEKLSELGAGNRSAAIEALLEWYLALDAAERGRESLLTDTAA
jgi:hypothetical protein